MVQSDPVHSGAVQYDEVWHSTVQCSVVQCDEVWYSAV